MKKLPKVKELDAEYSRLLTKRKQRYPDYRKARMKCRNWFVHRKM